MADELKSAKEYKKDLEAQVKEVNARIEELDRALSDAMAESELEKFTRNGSTFYLNNRLFASPRAERKEEMFHKLCEAPADQGQKALPDRDKDFPEEGDQLGGHWTNHSI